MPLAQCNETLLHYNRDANQKALRTGISKSQYCAYNPNRRSDSCPGDSGEPLQVFPSGSVLSTIVGIGSFGIVCGAELPSVYTRVAYYLYWIESIVWPNGELTT